MQQENCKGCRTFDYINDRGYKKTCAYFIFNKHGQCPCVKCVVKAICITDCPGFLEFTDPLDEILVRYSRHGKYEARR